MLEVLEKTTFFFCFVSYAMPGMIGSSGLVNATPSASASA